MHGVEINVKAMFKLLPVRRPILSVSRLVEKGFAVVMGKEQGNTVCKDGKVIHLHKSTGVPRPCDSVLGAVSTGGSTSKI